MNRLFLILLTFVFCQNLIAQDTIIKSNGDLVLAKVTEITSMEIKYKRFNFLDGPTYIVGRGEIKMIKYSNGLKEEFPVIPVNSIVVNETPDTYYNQGDRNSHYNYVTPAQIKYNKIEPRGSRFLYQNEFMSENELHRMLLKTKNKEIIMAVGKSKDAHVLQFIGFGAIPLGIAAIYLLDRSGYFPLYSYGNNYNNGDLALSAVCVVGAIACPIASGVFKHKRKESNRDAIEIYNAKF
jgi:hypothetical protein